VCVCVCMMRNTLSACASVRVKDTISNTARDISKCTHARTPSHRHIQYQNLVRLALERTNHQMNRKDEKCFCKCTSHRCDMEDVCAAHQTSEPLMASRKLCQRSIAKASLRFNRLLTRIFHCPRTNHRIVCSNRLLDQHIFAGLSQITRFCKCRKPAAVPGFNGKVND